MRIRDHRFGKATAGLAIATLAVFGATAHAQDSNKKSQSPALDNISLWVGGYYTSNDTNIGGKTDYLNTRGTQSRERSRL